MESHTECGHSVTSRTDQDTSLKTPYNRARLFGTGRRQKASLAYMACICSLVYIVCICWYGLSIEIDKKSYSKYPKRNTHISASCTYHKHTSYLPSLFSNPRCSLRSNLSAGLTYSAFLSFQALRQHISTLIPGRKEVWVEGRVNSVGKAIAIEHRETKRSVTEQSCAAAGFSHRFIKQIPWLPPHPAAPKVSLTDSS